MKLILKEIPSKSQTPELVREYLAKRLSNINYVRHSLMTPDMITYFLSLKGSHKYFDIFYKKFIKDSKKRGLTKQDLLVFLKNNPEGILYIKRYEPILVGMDNIKEVIKYSGDYIDLVTIMRDFFFINQDDKIYTIIKYLFELGHPISTISWVIYKRKDFNKVVELAIKYKGRFRDANFISDLAISKETLLNMETNYQLLACLFHGKDSDYAKKTLLSTLLNRELEWQYYLLRDITKFPELTEGDIRLLLEENPIVFRYMSIKSHNHLLKITSPKLREMLLLSDHFTLYDTLSDNELLDDLSEEFWVEIIKDNCNKGRVITRHLPKHLSNNATIKRALTIYRNNQLD